MFTPREASNHSEGREPACCDQDVIQGQIMPSTIHVFRMFRPDEVSVDFAATGKFLAQTELTSGGRLISKLAGAPSKKFY